MKSCGDPGSKPFPVWMSGCVRPPPRVEVVGVPAWSGGWPRSPPCEVPRAGWSSSAPLLLSWPACSRALLWSGSLLHETRSLLSAQHKACCAQASGRAWRSSLPQAASLSPSPGAHPPSFHLPDPSSSSSPLINACALWFSSRFSEVDQIVLFAWLYCGPAVL